MEEEVGIVCATQNSRNTHVERFWRRSEMKHIMKILECVVSYQPIRIAFLRLHRPPLPPASRIPTPNNSTRRILIALFQSTRIVFMYTQLALHHFRFFFLPSKFFSEKFIVFYFLSAACTLSSYQNQGRIEERFIIIFIAFQKICECTARRMKIFPSFPPADCFLRALIGNLSMGEQREGG